MSIFHAFYFDISWTKRLIEKVIYRTIDNENDCELQPKRTVKMKCESDFLLCSDVMWFLNILKVGKKMNMP